MKNASLIPEATRRNGRIVDFVDKAVARCRRSAPDTFWKMRSDLDDLLDPEIWRSFYTEVIRQIASRPSFDGGREWHSSGIAVHDSAECFLSLRVCSPKGVGLPKPLTSTAQLVSTRPAPAMWASLSAEPLPLRIHALPSGTDLDVFDPSTSIEGYRDILAQPWTRVDIDAPRELVELRARPDQVWCLLEFSLKPLKMQRWEFDSSTGAAVGTALASTDSACLMAMLHEVTRIRHTEAWPHVQKLIDHADFNIRWAALRCLGQIHPPAAMESLPGLARDIHPMIAAMAKRLIAQLPNPPSHATQAD